jgi:hypothetical protein
VAQFPFYQVEDQDQVYNTLIHGKPFIGGFFNAFPPEQYLRIRPVMEGFPDETSVGLLKELGIRYLIVDTAAYADVDQVFHDMEELGAAFMKRIGEEAVFVLPEP